MAGFIHDYPSGQEDIFDILHLLVKNISGSHDDRELFVWDVVIFVFHENRSLCEVVPRSLVVKMGELVAQSAHSNPRLLDFFLQIVYPVKGENCIVSNQNAVIEILTYPSCCLLLEYPGSEAAQQVNKKEPVVKRPSFWKEEEKGDQEVTGASPLSEFDLEKREEFCLKSLQLLGLCAKGRNSKVAAKNQSLLDFNDALRALYAVRTRNHVVLKTSLVAYILSTFIDTPLVDRKLSERKEVYQLLSFANDEYCVLATSRLRGTLASSVSSPASPTNEFRRHLELDANGLDNLDDQEDEDVKGYALALLELVASLLVTMDGEVRLKNGQKILDSVRQGLRGGGLDDPEVEAARRKCSDIMDGRTGTFDPVRRAESIQHGRESLRVSDSGDDEVGGAVVAPELVEEGEFAVQLTKLCGNLEDDDRVKETIRKADDDLLSIVESVEELTDPEDREYLEAGVGFSVYKKKKKTRLTYGEMFFRGNYKVLKVLQGTRMLFLILVLVAVAAACTISGIALNTDISWVVEIENYITWFFIVELGLRVTTYLVVHHELDTFLVDPLNLCDILVVTIDLVLINAESQGKDGGENDSAGFVKSLRSARGIRLLRLLRAARALRLLKKRRKMTQKEALADPRSCKITWKMLSKRMLSFCNNQCENADKDTAVTITLKLLVNHLKRSLKRREYWGEDLSDVERIRMQLYEVKRAREIEHVKNQRMLSNEGGAPQVILKILSRCRGPVFDDALTLGEQLLCARNYNGQGVFFR